MDKYRTSYVDIMTVDLLETWCWMASAKCVGCQKGCLEHRFALAFSLQLNEY